MAIGGLWKRFIRHVDPPCLDERYCTRMRMGLSIIMLGECKKAGGWQRAADGLMCVKGNLGGIVDLLLGGPMGWGEEGNQV